MTNIAEIIPGIVQLQSSATIGVALMVCVCALSASYSVSRLGCKYLDSAARQPEIAGKLFSDTLLIGAMVELMPLLGMVICFLFVMTSPLTTAALKLLPAVS